jgi:uncharacterized protein YeaO (DUF488 family)
VILHTVQLAKHRQVAAMGVKLVDTTAKTGKFFLAPTWDMVMAYKNGQMPMDEYSRRYKDRMLQMFNQYRPEWEEVLAIPEMALGCYCAPGAFCHRHLLKAIFETICQRRGIPFEYAGEIGYRAHEEERVPS